MSLLTKAQLCDGLYAANAADKRRKLCFRSASGVAEENIKDLDSGLFRKFKFEARLLKKLGYFMWKHIHCKMCVRL